MIIFQSLWSSWDERWGSSKWLLHRTDWGARVAGKSSSSTSSKRYCEFVPSLLPSISSCHRQRRHCVSERKTSFLPQPDLAGHTVALGSGYRLNHKKIAATIHVLRYCWSIRSFLLAVSSAKAQYWHNWPKQAQHVDNSARAIVKHGAWRNTCCTFPGKGIFCTPLCSSFPYFCNILVPWHNTCKPRPHHAKHKTPPFAWPQIEADKYSQTRHALPALGPAGLVSIIPIGTK